METCLLNYFVLNKELKSSCDFNPFLFKEGPAVYEVVRIIEQKPLFLEDHLERFFHSLELSGIPSGLQEKQIKSRLKALIEINKLKNGNIRFQFSIHPHSGPLFLAWIAPTFYPTTVDYSKGISMMSLQAERQNPNAKRDNLPVREQANQLIQRHDVFEALLINNDGFVTEGSRSNVFFIRNTQIITPPLSEVLPGVTRAKIIHLATENGIDMVEQPIRFTDIKGFAGIFISGTSIGILPVNRVDSMNFPPKNPLVQKVQQLYKQLCLRYLKDFSF